MTSLSRILATRTDKKSRHAMTAVPPFYSVNEAKKPATLRVNHNNNVCPSGRDIPQQERRTGIGGYRLCDDCQRYKREGR